MPGSDNLTVVSVSMVVDPIPVVDELELELNEVLDTAENKLGAPDVVL